MDRSPELPEPENEREQEWIEENRTLFWLAATAACEIYGPGALLVDLISQPQAGGRPFSYHAEGELELNDEMLALYLAEYDPVHEFIVVLLKPGPQIAVHLESGPSLG